MLIEEMEGWEQEEQAFLEVEEYREWICRDDEKWSQWSKEGKVG